MSNECDIPNCHICELHRKEAKESDESEIGCVWAEDEWGTWASGCKQGEFEFTEGGPKENRFIFCPYCSGVLVGKPFSDEPES